MHRLPVSRLYVVLACLASLVAVTAAAAQGAGSGDPLPTYEITLTPNYVSPQDNKASNYQNVWIYPKSATTPYRSPDSFKQQTRYLLLDPRFKDADGRQGHDDWWFIVERNWPASYNPANHGKWGRETNFHNVAGDAGPAGSGGVGWSFGTGVSSLAMDWLTDRNAPSLSVNPDATARDMALPAPTRDQWHTYVVHFVAGRTDGTTPRPGAITVWVDGKDTPHIDKRNINTVQRAQGPDGKWYVQRWMVLWEGDYTSALPASATTRFVLTRIGKSFQEALDDRPVVSSTNVQGQYYTGTGTNVGPPTAKQIASRTPAQSLIPSSLGGSTPPPPPPPTAPTYTSSVKDGDTVTKGTAWSATVSPTPDRVEFWANGSKLADLAAGPYQTAVNLAAGSHKLGLVSVKGGVRTVHGTSGVVANVTVVDPPPPPPPPPPAPTFTSSVKDGDTVTKGATWSVSVSPTPDRVELWANGSKLADLAAGPYQTALNLPAGTHKLGIVAVKAGVRTVFGTSGVVATVKVVDPPPPPPPPFTFTSSVQNGATVVRGTLWTVTFSSSVSRVELYADGKKLADLKSAPYRVPLNLSNGAHTLGIAVTRDGVRTVLGTNGVVATITVKRR